MSLNWETFKSALGSYWNTSCIMYVDEEGSEIPIGSECEFQEALRIAKLNKNRLKLILYDKKIPSSQKMFMTFPESVRIFTPNKTTGEADKNAGMYSSTSNSNVKENTCICGGGGGGGVPPEWFTHYMKKFKKDLLHELKLNIVEVIDSKLEKVQERCNGKLDPVEFFHTEKSETLLSPATTQTKKKKKVSDKDGVDISEQRDLKLSKKLEKLHLMKSDKLEKLDNRTKLLLEEKKKLLEKKRHSKSKQDKNLVIYSEKRIIPKRSACFLEDDVYLFLTPGGEFTLTLSVKNNGRIPLLSPRVECFDATGLFLREASIGLPRLLPSECCVTTLRGMAVNAVGLHHFKCRIIENLEKISTEFTCWARVDFFEPREKYSNVFVHTKVPNFHTLHSEGPIEKLIDFDKDVIADSEKKIEENIIEIQRRLQYIDLLRPPLIPEEIHKKTSAKTKKTLAKNIEFQTESCDSSPNVEEKERNWSNRLHAEGIQIGVDCLRFASDNNEAREMKANEKTDEIKQSGDLEEVKKDCELESSSDSDVSVIFMSEEEEGDNEEEENFIVVSLPSKSSGPSESGHEVLDKKCVTVSSNDKAVVSDKQPELASLKERPLKTDAASEIQNPVDKGTSTPKNLSPNQFSSTWNRRSPFGEEIPKTKHKKMKSKSTEYHFTAADLTQPTFSPIPDRDRFVRERPPKFTFTGGKKGKSPDCVFEFTFTGGGKGEEAQKDDLRKTVPTTDAFGRIIYAVNNKGHCLPVSDLFENGEHSRNSPKETLETPDDDDEGSQIRRERRSDRYNEIPSVNILPNVLMNGASNVASIAFNTARSVINNLQSAFVTEGKTELGKPACEEKKKVSMENMFRLYEMGFSDLQVNRKLLLIHDNDISKVIEELVRLEDNSSKNPE